MAEGLKREHLLGGLTKIVHVLLAEMLEKGHLPMVILAGSKPVDGKYECSIWPVSPDADPADLARVMGEAAAAIKAGQAIREEVGPEEKGGAG